MSEINISRKDLNNINDSPIVRMEGVKGAAELFGLPKHLATIWRTEPISVEKLLDDLRVGVKG